MSRRCQQKETKGILHEKQKNGDTYVYEAVYRYDQATKKNRRISRKLVGRIPAGSQQTVPTRKKRPNGEGPIGKAKREAEEARSQIQAEREHRQLGNILEWAGEQSGIDADVKSSMNEADALKTISIARFLTATDGETIPRFEDRQLTRDIPYEKGMSNFTCYALFQDLGEDEAVRQRLFSGRSKRLEGKPLIAYDSAPIRTYSDNQPEARYGYDPERRAGKVIRYMTLYAAESRQPIAFAKKPGNLTDIDCLSRALSQLAVLGPRDPQAVTDNGYYSEENIMEMCRAGVDFITLGKPTIDWVKPVANELLEGIESSENFDPDGAGTYAASKTIRHEFTYVRKRGSKKKGLKAGDREPFVKSVAIHICLNPVRKAQEDADFRAELLEIKDYLERGGAPEKLPGSARAKADKYLTIARRRKSVKVAWNDEERAKACAYRRVRADREQGKGWLRGSPQVAEAREDRGVLPDGQAGRGRRETARVDAGQPHGTDDGPVRRPVLRGLSAGTLPRDP